MNHFNAHAAGRPTSKNEKTVAAWQGVTTASQVNIQADYLRSGLAPQLSQAPKQLELGDRLSAFNQLARQFDQLGLSLHPLGDESLLVSSPALGMSRTLPDLRTAKAYLRMVGGAA